ncbi:MAG: hypothetical protein AVDCRST_MAG20-1923, partial [uncultured Acidimicrobiales bacterium]
ERRRSGSRRCSDAAGRAGRPTRDPHGGGRDAAVVGVPPGRTRL